MGCGAVEKGATEQNALATIQDTLRFSGFSANLFESLGARKRTVNNRFENKVLIPDRVSHCGERKPAILD